MRASRLLMVSVLFILGGGLLAWFTQTSGGIRLVDVRFVGTGGAPMSALLYIPKNATPATPAPGILAVHGYFNSREAQDGFAIEFARRGYVVLAIDQRGHGYSAPPAFAAGFGGPDGLRYLRSLDFVDKDNIGLEGHSMGGWAVVNAAAAFPQGYRAIVLEGSSTGMPFAPEGTPAFPRNLAVVFSRFDEFSATMWGVPKARDVFSSQKLGRVFGVAAPVEQGKLYGSLEEGTGRILYTPAITHPMDHFSTEAIGYSLDWMQRTLRGGTPKPVSDQIWYWKEIGTCMALVGFVIWLLGLFDALVRLPYFASLLAAPEVPARRPGAAAWAGLAIAALLPAILLLPLCELADHLLPPARLLPQTFTNEILFWALCSGLISYALSMLWRLGKAEFNTRGIPSLVIAVLVAGGGYVACAMVDFLFKIDFRIWFIGVKLMSTGQARAFLVYVLPFALSMVLILRALYSNPLLRAANAVTQYGLALATLAGGFVLFVLFEYLTLFSTGQLPVLYPFDGLRVILSIQFIPLLAIVAVVATFTFRRTNGYLPGALLAALFITWVVVAGQATQA